MNLEPEIEIPDVLYKYRDFSGINRHYVQQIILDNKALFSSPADFNDPFDCKVNTSFRGSRSAWQEHVADLLRKYRSELNHEQRQAEKRRILHEKRHRDPSVF